jgi:hypothetical protein
MVDRLKFTAYPPGTQDAQTFRQFQELQQYLDALEDALKPIFGGGDVDPVPVLDPVIWTELVLLSSTVPQISGVYWASLRLGMVGSNPTSQAQIRLTYIDWNGIPQEFIGGLVTIGINDLVSVTWSGSVALGHSLQLWVRGTQVEVLEGRFNVSRQGTGSQ